MSDAVPVSAAVATRSRGDGRSMEDRRRKSVSLNYFFTNQMSHFNHKRHSDFGRFLVCYLQQFYTNYQLGRHSVAICLGS